MQITPAESQAFIQLAFARLMTAADQAEANINSTPDLPSANSIFQIVTHCLGVAGYWMNHIILAEPSHRDRDAEFTASGTLAELHAGVDQFLTELPTLLQSVHAAPEIDATAALPSGGEQRWPMTNAGVLLHVIEELFQHAGHAEITADLLTS